MPVPPHVLLASCSAINLRDRSATVLPLVEDSLGIAASKWPRESIVRWSSAVAGSSRESHSPAGESGSECASSLSLASPLNSSSCGLTEALGECDPRRTVAG